MRRVCVDETATVGAEHLNRDLRGHWTLHDVLFGDGLFLHHRLSAYVQHRLTVFVHLRDGDFHRLYQRSLGIGLEVLNHAPRDKEHREDDTDWDQQVIGHAHEVDPKIADGLYGVPRNTTN